MKKLVIIIVILLAGVLLVVTGCQTDENEPITTTEEFSPEQAPDDIVSAPGLGPQYRANIHQPGVEIPGLKFR